MKINQSSGKVIDYGLLTLTAWRGGNQIAVWLRSRGRAKGMAWLADGRRSSLRTPATKRNLRASLHDIRDITSGAIENGPLLVSNVRSKIEIHGL